MSTILKEISKITVNQIRDVTNGNIPSTTRNVTQIDAIGHLDMMTDPR